MKRFIYIVFILCFTSTAFAGQYSINQTQQQYPQYQTQKCKVCQPELLKKEKMGQLFNITTKARKSVHIN